MLAKDGTVRAVAYPKGTDRKGSGGQSRNAAHFGRPASTGAPAAPQVRMVEITDVWTRGAVAWAAGPCRTGETTLAGHLESCSCVETAPTQHRPGLFRNTG